MSNIRSNVEDLNNMILQGQALEAFEKHYADDVVMVEGNEVFEGKDTNRERERDFFSKVTEFRGAAVKGLAVADDISMVEWHFDYTHAEWGEQKYDQVAVQRWRDGKVVHERFYRAV